MTSLALAARRSDDNLVTAARAGSSAAESEMVRRYRPVLTRYCARLVGPDLAEDAVNQALLQALVALRSAEQPAVLRPWLFRIAHNCAVDVGRSKSAHDQLEDRACTAIGPSARMEQRETMRSIVGELRRLAPHERRALVAREFEGSSYVDIADELGHSVGAVRQMIFRARQRVRHAAAALLPLLRLPVPLGGDALGVVGTCATTAVLAASGAVAPQGSVDAEPVGVQVTPIVALSHARASDFAEARKRATSTKSYSAAASPSLPPPSPPAPAPAPVATTPAAATATTADVAADPTAIDEPDVQERPSRGTRPRQAHRHDRHDNANAKAMSKPSLDDRAHGRSRSPDRQGASTTAPDHHLAPKADKAIAAAARDRPANGSPAEARRRGTAEGTVGREPGPSPAPTAKPAPAAAEVVVGTVAGHDSGEIGADRASGGVAKSNR